MVHLIMLQRLPRILEAFVDDLPDPSLCAIQRS
jgi:hypothetical protein